MARTPTPGPGTEEREKSRELGALRALLPFLAPYRGLMIAAILALVLTAMISLTLPLAVRRVIDNFGTGEAELLDQYFVAALIIAALLAGGTGLRYALVTRFGERVVADIRKAVFDRVNSMRPACSENLMNGGVLGRGTPGPKLILTVDGASVSSALAHMPSGDRRGVGAGGGAMARPPAIRPGAQGCREGAGPVQRRAGSWGCTLPRTRPAAPIRRS